MFHQLQTWYDSEKAAVDAVCGPHEADGWTRIEFSAGTQLVPPSGLNARRKAVRVIYSERRDQYRATLQRL